LGSIYLKPIAGLETVDFSYSALVITNEATNDYTQASITMSVETKLMDAVIHTTNDVLLDNLTLHYYHDGVDTGISTEVVEGGITINTNIDFDSVQLSVADAYQGDINIMDMYGVLDNIAQEIDTFAEHAADNNNDGSVNIVDMYDVLDDIGQTSQTFDLVDEMGNLVTSLNTDLIDVGNWTIVANGDVDQSGGFGDAYLISVDIV
jgi:hypothetical protein